MVISMKWLFLQVGERVIKTHQKGNHNPSIIDLHFESSTMVDSKTNSDVFV